MDNQQNSYYGAANTSPINESQIGQLTWKQRIDSFPNDFLIWGSLSFTPITRTNRSHFVQTVVE